MHTCTALSASHSHIVQRCGTLHLCWRGGNAASRNKHGESGGRSPPRMPLPQDCSRYKAARLTLQGCGRGSAQVMDATGLALAASRLSGNPVQWQPPGDAPGELLAMVHTRMGAHAYAHWALRLDSASLAITHNSVAPVIQSASYELGGYFEGVLIVGSFHVVLAPDGQQVLSSPWQHHHSWCLDRATLLCCPGGCEAQGPTCHCHCRHC